MNYPPRHSRWAAFLLVSAVTCGPAAANEYPWLTPANTQVITFENFFVDMAARMAAIQRAKSNISGVTYLHDADPTVGIPLLHAMRSASARGIPLRYLYDRVPSWVFDWKNHPRLMLADSSLKQPGEILGLNAWRKIRAGLNISDQIHMKILIIDGGTDDEIIWLSGRNNAGMEAAYLDFSIALRRLEKGKPYIGDQIRAAFNDEWDTARLIQDPYTPRKEYRGDMPIVDNDPEAILAAPEQPEGDRTWRDKSIEAFRAVNAFLARPVAPGAPLAPFESRPEAMRTITNGFLSFALTGVYGRTFKSRHYMPSDIIDGTAPYIASSQDIYITLQSVFMPAALKESIKVALRAGARVTLMTNSRAAHRGQPMPQEGLFDLSLLDIVDLMQVEGGELNVQLLDPEKIQKGPEDARIHRLIRYFHQKAVIHDDYVALGSENFNETSRMRNSEIAVQIKDRAFADTMRAMFNRDMRAFNPITCSQALEEARKYTRLRRIRNRILLPFY